MLRIVLTCLAALSLGGCTAISALNGAATPQDMYQLRAPSGAPVVQGSQGIQFVVEVPAANAAIATGGVLVRPTPSQITYLPDARWSDTAPVMLQAAMIETFLRAGAFRYVGTLPLGVSGDVALVSNLLDFGADVLPDRSGATVRITLVARLVRESDAQIVASRTFTQAVPVEGLSTPALMSGFEAASNAMIVELAGWVYSVRGLPVVR